MKTKLIDAVLIAALAVFFDAFSPSRLMAIHKKMRLQITMTQVILRQRPGFSHAAIPERTDAGACACRSGPWACCARIHLVSSAQPVWAPPGAGQGLGLSPWLLPVPSWGGGPPLMARSTCPALLRLVS